jgi:hypothetical protein
LISSPSTSPQSVNLNGELFNINDLADLAKTDVGSWAILNQIYLPTSGQVFGFAGHEYLEEPYKQRGASLLVFQKGAQLGFSEFATLTSYHDCAFRLRSGLIYYFPTKSDVTEFSKARFGPILEDNPVLRGMVQDTDAANIKRVGKCMLYLRGLRSSVSAKSAPADKLIFDEIDEAPPDRVDLAMKRLDHSDFQEVMALSTPTIPDYGINALFQKTDQRYRQIHCTHCGRYTCLERDFPDCLMRTRDGSVARVCRSCRRELDLGNPKNEYVADFPGREWRGKPAVGYRISQLHSRYVPMATILDEYENLKFPQDFWNSRLAEAWIDASHRLEVNQVLALCAQHPLEYASAAPTAVGVDIGPVQHHVVVARKEMSNTARIIWMGTTDWDGLHGILARYNATMVMDGLPEPDKAKKFAKDNPYRAWACFYSQKPSVPLRWNEVDGIVTVYQTEAMDASHAMLQMGKVILPKRSQECIEFANHCHDVARKKVENEETGEVKYQWVKVGKQIDHYRKAFNFMSLAMEKTGESNYGGMAYADLANAGLARTYAKR